MAKISTSFYRSSVSWTTNRKKRRQASGFVGQQTSGSIGVKIGPIELMVSSLVYGSGTDLLEAQRSKLSTGLLDQW